MRFPGLRRSSWFCKSCAQSPCPCNAPGVLAFLLFRDLDSCFAWFGSFLSFSFSGFVLFLHGRVLVGCFLHDFGFMPIHTPSPQKTTQSYTLFCTKVHSMITGPRAHSLQRFSLLPPRPKADDLHVCGRLNLFGISFLGDPVGALLSCW